MELRARLAVPLVKGRACTTAERTLEAAKPEPKQRISRPHERTQKCEEAIKVHRPKGRVVIEVVCIEQLCPNADGLEPDECQMELLVKVPVDVADQALRGRM